MTKEKEETKVNPSAGIKSVNSIVAPIIGTGAIFTGSAEAMMRKTAEKIVIGIAIHHGAFADSNPVRECAIPIRIAATGKNKIHRDTVIYLANVKAIPDRWGSVLRGNEQEKSFPISSRDSNLFRFLLPITGKNNFFEGCPIRGGIAPPPWHPTRPASGRIPLHFLA